MGASVTWSLLLSPSEQGTQDLDGWEMSEEVGLEVGSVKRQKYHRLGGGKEMLIPIKD